MKISEIITAELKQKLDERYYSRRVLHTPLRRRLHAPTSVARALPKPQPVKAPARRNLKQQTIKRPVTQRAKPLKKPMVPKIQTIGLNPKIDSMKGPNFKLDDRNILPQFEKNFGINDKSKGT
jgi:hypothetical protein